MQCQVVVAAIPVPAIMSLVFSVTFTQYITQNNSEMSGTQISRTRTDPFCVHYILHSQTSQSLLAA